MAGSEALPRDGARREIKRNYKGILMQLKVKHEVEIFFSHEWARREKKKELACKPGSVEDSHSSATAITDCL